ncbi:glutamyl-tRNA reductase [Myxococcota bacterium]|nr:glutamyl-tRNA reductase [Myxococcota bacterium]
MKVLLVGMNHNTAPVEVRERIFIDDPAPLLQKLKHDPDIEEVVLLSTCNRTEILVGTRSVDAARVRLHSFIANDMPSERPIQGVEDYLYEYIDGEAMGHLMRVASSLDSMVVGEPQIAGQSKDAYAAAVEAGSCGPILSRLFQTAFTAAKRVRTETQIAERPVSVARVGVSLASQIFESLEGKQALMIGAGEMIELAMKSLRGAGLSSLAVANRTVANAEALAEDLGGSAHGLDELPELLERADIVLSCIGTDRPVLTREQYDATVERHRNRPIFVIDLGVPRNVDPELAELDNVFLYDIDDLGEIARANTGRRKRETERAEQIIEEERQRLEGWFVALRAAPTIKTLRARVEEIRNREIDRAIQRSKFDPSEREELDAITRSIVNKILHAPMTTLKREAEREEGLAYLEAARVLFAIDDEDESDEDD